MEQNNIKLNFFLYTVKYNCSSRKTVTVCNISLAPYLIKKYQQSKIKFHSHSHSNPHHCNDGGRNENGQNTTSFSSIDDVESNKKALDVAVEKKSGEINNAYVPDDDTSSVVSRFKIFFKFAKFF